MNCTVNGMEEAEERNDRVERGEKRGVKKKRDQNNAT